MIAQIQDSLFSLTCKVERCGNRIKLTPMGDIFLNVGNNDELEQQTEMLGQGFKRMIYLNAVEEMDQQIAAAVQVGNKDLIKNGTAKFTFVTLFGDVKVHRQRLYNKTTGESITPAAIAWNTSQHRHINHSVIHQICEDTQNESYRKATDQLNNISGQDSLVSTTTVWNVKQKQGKKIEQKQNDFVESVTKKHAQDMIKHGLLPADFVSEKSGQNTTDTIDNVANLEERHLSQAKQREVDELFFYFAAPEALEICTIFEACTTFAPYTSVEICTAILLDEIGITAQEEQVDPLSEESRKITHENIRQRCHVEKGTISVQLDEVLSRSQEDGKTWNLTATATIEDDQGNVYYLTAKSTEELLHLVAAKLMMLGITNGKKLEVLGDGASWIEKWLKGLIDISVTWILCWYHLSRKVYELLSGLGWDKARKKEFERKVLGVLWYGNVAEAIELLRGVMGEAKTPKRIEDLIGYLERKQDCIVNYAERHEQGLWIASTRVEKWNDLSVSDRCKRRGMSWTLDGVMAVAYYASEKRNGKLNLNTAN